MHISRKAKTSARPTAQWSFRITGTTKTLASQAEIGVWLQEPGALLWVQGYYHMKNI